MSGIYFHIPFCKVKCNYCDFYRSTDLSYTNVVLSAIEKELSVRKDYITDKRIETIYFGGGTPSLLKKEQLTGLLNLIYSNFNVTPGVEITFEANPDDLSPEYLDQLITSGINRLSIGIQSFSDSDLKFMGRRHSSQQAIDAVKNAQQAGFNNISIDLIYGIPGMSFQQWQRNLNQAFDLKVQHLSAYHLTYHEGTAFWSNLQKGVLTEVDEEDSLQQFEELITKSAENNFIQYEISNFALEWYYSRHNSSYWKQVEYLGLGPSAHSYNKTTRYWNPSDTMAYLKAIQAGKAAGEFEVLTLTDKFNDYLITSLRTIWGIDKDYIKTEFGDKIVNYLENKLTELLISGVIEKRNNKFYITKKGIFISDRIIEELFLSSDNHEH
jgi:oxygen-independent coproporphyrinogen III oxidase